MPKLTDEDINAALLGVFIKREVALLTTKIVHEYGATHGDQIYKELMDLLDRVAALREVSP